MGDHGEMSRVAFDVDPNETVHSLVQRIADATNKSYRSITDNSPRTLRPGDCIEIRQVVHPPTETEPLGF